MKPIAVNMMVWIIFCMTVTAFFYAKAWAQTESSTSQVIIGRKEEPPEVKGPVQRIESKQIRFRNGIFKRSEKIISWDQTAYNSQGRPVETISFKSNGKPDGKEVMSHDNRGNLTERIAYDPGNIVTVKVNFKYDAHDRLIEELWYNPGYAHIACGDYYKTVYKYDDRKRTTETLNYDGQNQLVLRRLETYNLDGTVSEMVCENPTRGYAICPAGKRAYKYDSRGNRIEQAQYDMSGKYTGSIFRKYNDQGKEIEWEMPGLIRVVSFYDPNGVNIESATYSSSGRISTKTKYDSRGREIMRTGLRPDGVLIKDYYVREFDVYGNLLKETWWRKEIPSGNSVPLSEWLKEEKDMGTMIEVIEHKISYYN